MTINSQVVGSENSPLYTEKQLDYAWAAGIMDGEGSIFAAQRYDEDGYSRKSDFRLSITQSSDNVVPEMLLHLKNIFRVGKIYKHKKRKLHHKQKYEYVIVCNQAIRVLRLIWFKLGEVKRKQAIEAGYEPVD